jgi:hypothetical protein
LENGNFPVSTTVHANKKEKIEEKEGKEALPKRDKKLEQMEEKEGLESNASFQTGGFKLQAVGERKDIRL